MLRSIQQPVSLKGDIGFLLDSRTCKHCLHVHDGREAEALKKKYKPIRVEERLTEKERRFVELFNGENLFDAVMGAGYGAKNRKNALVMGNNLLSKEKIQRALSGQSVLQRRKDIADKGERMQFLTAVMRDAEQPILARIRACELMGKAFGDYIERHEVDINQNVLVLNNPMRLGTLQMAKELASRLIDPFKEDRPREVEPVVDVELLTDGASSDVE